MIADHETNVVFVADALKRRFPDVYQGLSSILGGHGIPLRTIPGAKQVWCRDYMPIQVGEGRFVQFRYSPDYLGGRYRHLRTDGEIGPTLAVARDCERAEIVLDGGNLVKWSDRAILTDKILIENPGWNPKSLLAELERLLEVGRIILIPSEPGDITGHADGIVRFVNGGKVVVNDYRRADRDYRKVLLRSLEKAGLQVAEIPYRPVPEWSAGMPSAVGNYVNFLQVRSIIVVPNYGAHEDGEVHERLMLAYPGSELIGLKCRELARCGGVLSCSTWSVILPAHRAGIAGIYTSGDPSRRPS